jgi:hypothetical protein
LPSLRSLGHFSISVLSFSTKCWPRFWAVQNLVRPVTLKLCMTAPNASWMACTMHGMWFLIVGD